MTKRNSETVEELSLEALDTVMGGSAAPMGLGGSIMPTSRQNAALAGHGPVGYQDHFGLHLGHNPSATGHGLNSPTGPAAAGAAQSPVGAGVTSSAPSPMGLGGSTAHGTVNATSAFQLVEQASPQDAQAQDAQSQDAGAALPEGLGGDSQ